MAVKAALFATLIPRISVTAVDGGEPELELSDDPYDGNKLADLLERAPVLVTLSRIGNYCVVDPTPEEEACSSSSLVIAVTPKGTFCKNLFNPPYFSDSIFLKIYIPC